MIRAVCRRWIPGNSVHLLALSFRPCRQATGCEQSPQPDQAPGQPINLTSEQRSFPQARAILKRTTLPATEQEVRLQVLKATLTGTVIRPDDDYPEIRNPKYWTLSNRRVCRGPGEHARRGHRRSVGRA